MAAPEEKQVVLSKSSLLPLGVAAALMAGTASGSWMVSAAMTSMSNSIKVLGERMGGLELAVKESRDQGMSRRSFRLWAELLEQSNRGMTLVVPDLPE
jgi:hypothetical protein